MNAGRVLVVTGWREEDEVRRRDGLVAAQQQQRHEGTHAVGAQRDFICLRDATYASTAGTK